MINQKFIPAIDASAIIWNEQHYIENRVQYRSILLGLSQMILALKNLKILISPELQSELIGGFPHSEIAKKDNDLWASIGSLYYFLSNIGSKAIPYEKVYLDNLVSNPNQIKEHFSDQTQSEVHGQMGYFHRNPEAKRVYFSFDMFWNESNTLVTELDEQKEHTAVIIDRGTEFDDYLNQFILKFEHKTKHDISRYGNKEAWLNRDTNEDFISQLSCMSVGTEEAERLLDKRYDVAFGNDTFYSYDSVNEVYVVFRKTGNNIYHAHDEYDIQKIPKKVLTHFNVFKYNL
jgi:hypothetical protein